MWCAICRIASRCCISGGCWRSARRPQCSTGRIILIPRRCCLRCRRSMATRQPGAHPSVRRSAERGHRRRPAACFIRAVRASSARSASSRTRLSSMPAQRRCASSPRIASAAISRVDELRALASRTRSATSNGHDRPGDARATHPEDRRRADRLTRPFARLSVPRVSSPKRFHAIFHRAHRTCSSPTCRCKAFRPVAWISLSICPDI